MPAWHRMTPLEPAPSWGQHWGQAGNGPQNLPPALFKMATTNTLSDVTIRKAKPGEKPRKLSDGGGLYLELQPNGASVGA